MATEAQVRTAQVRAVAFENLMNLALAAAERSHASEDLVIKKILRQEYSWLKGLAVTVLNNLFAAEPNVEPLTEMEFYKITSVDLPEIRARHGALVRRLHRAVEVLAEPDDVQLTEEQMAAVRQQGIRLRDDLKNLLEGLPE